MDLNLFYIEVLKALDKRDVEILLVGGFAVGFHGYARYTNDLDLWVNPKESNLKKLGLAIKDLNYSQDVFDEILNKRPIDHPTPIRLFSDDNGFYIDLMTSIFHDFTFEECYQRANSYKLDGFSLPVIDILDLIDIKKNIKRFDENLKDIVDAQQLRKIYDARTSLQLKPKVSFFKMLFNKVFRNY